MEVTKTDPLRGQRDETPETDARGPQLFKMFECDDPLAPSARIGLAEYDEVLVGRERERVFRRETRGSRRVIHVALVDTCTSTHHARVVRTEQGWTLVDSGSKNGTFVNGQRRESVVLRDGDLIEVGHVFFMYRASSHGVGVETADALRSPAPELATFVKPLEYQFELLARVASKPLANVMLLGETGTGKEVVAKGFHKLSKRPGPFVAVNCAALPATLFEAELFGYRRGAFSGAIEDRSGLVRAADRGTLFLDEIGDLSLASQVSLLRVLQEREVMPLGSSTPVKVDIQVVSATHRDPRALVESGQFRRDLLARLGGFRLVLPALRERREDFGILSAALLQRIARSHATPRFSMRAASALLNYGWPLNVRELDACLSTAVALAADGIVEMGYLPDVVQESIATTSKDSGNDSILGSAEAALRSRLAASLSEHSGNVARVANAMGKAPTQIHRWIKRFGLELREFRRSRE